MLLGTTLVSLSNGISFRPTASAGCMSVTYRQTDEPPNGITCQNRWHFHFQRYCLKMGWFNKNRVYVWLSQTLCNDLSPNYTILLLFTDWLIAKHDVTLQLQQPKILTKNIKYDSNSLSYTPAIFSITVSRSWLQLDKSVEMHKTHDVQKQLQAACRQPLLLVTYCDNFYWFSDWCDFTLCPKQVYITQYDDTQARSLG